MNRRPPKIPGRSEPAEYSKPRFEQEENLVIPCNNFLVITILVSPAQSPVDKVDSFRQNFRHAQTEDEDEPLVGIFQNPYGSLHLTPAPHPVAG